MFKKILITILLLSSALPVFASGDDVVFSEDVLLHIDDLNINLTVKAGSKVEQLTVGSSYFTATLASGSSLTVESPNRRDLANSAVSTNCPADTSQSSSITLTAAGTVTVTPSAEQCSTPAGGAVAIVGGGGGGGGGGGSATANTADNGTQTTAIQSSAVSSDGTQIISNTSFVKANGVSIEVKSEATINIVANPTVNQSVSVNTSSVADVKEVRVELPKEVLSDLASAYGADKDITVKIESREAKAEQKTNEARVGMFLIGFDIFTVNLNVSGSAIKNFNAPLTLSFNVSNISNPQDLKVYYYNEAGKKWELAGDGGKVVGDKIEVQVSHLTDFALMKEIKKTSLNEIVNDKDLQWQQVLSDAATALKSGINNFIANGTKSTVSLGKGERAGVVNSYKSAFGKSPATESEWKDCIAIANGRWPSLTSATAEYKAKQDFKKVYKRDANMKNTNDSSAVKIMAYGLRPANRNVNSEKAAIRIYKNIYKKSPSSANDWDIIRAIAYSGAKR